MNQIKLSEGALEKILSGSYNGVPIVQILAFKNVSAVDVDRFRVILSDGVVSYKFCVILGSLVNKFYSSEIKNYAIIGLEKYTCIKIRTGKILIIITDVKVMNGDVGSPLGNPIPRNDEGIASIVEKPVKKPDPTASCSRFIKEVTFDEDQIVPISQISLFLKNLVIRGRITKKSGVKIWNNAKGSGKLFSFNMADMSSEIKITAFRVECDKHFEVVELGKVYLLANATVKQASTKWNNCENSYELALNSGSILKLDTDNEHQCPQITFNFVKIKELESIPSNSMVDILGICNDFGELSTINSKTGKELKKRDISLMDDSEVEIRLTIWNTDAEMFNGKTGTVVIVKKARLTDYGGKSLTTNAATALQIDPNLPEAHTLRNWFSSEGDKIKPTRLSMSVGRVDEIQYLSQISKANVINARNEILVTNCAATIMHTGKTLFYMGCPGCKKKLEELEDECFKCRKCEKTFIQGEHRMVVNFCISDITNSVWVTAFTEEAEKVIGMEVNDIISEANGDEKQLEEIVDCMLFKKFQFHLRSNLDFYNGEVRIKSTVLKTTNSDGNYYRKLLSKINEIISE